MTDPSSKRSDTAALGIITVFLRWTATRALLHRGYWLVASLYLVLDARLSPFQLVLLGTGQGIVSLIFEIPTGVVADTISRRWSLIIAHLLIGTSMALTGLVTAFPALVATQMLWGLGWTFASGADIAWITDELDQPRRIGGVLTARARWDLTGAAGGMIAIGSIAWGTSRGTAIVTAGLAMILLGAYVAMYFPERNFTPTRVHRRRQSFAVLRRGVDLARHDRQILLIFAANAVLNGVAELYGRLYPRRLVHLGLPDQPDPIVWFTALGITTSVTGAVILRVVQGRIDGAGTARFLYAGACMTAVAGLTVLAVAPGVATGGVGVLLVTGIAWPVTRVTGEIWINRRATSEVRATAQSFLSQTEYAGEIGIGVGLAALARSTSITVALLCSCALVACVAVVVARSPAD